MLNTKTFLTIKEVNQYIKNLLDGDSLLSSLWVKGEISNFKAHSSGHFYFTLKDTSGSLKCVMFKSRSQKLKFKPEHGMQVFALGYISVYERDGQYQLYVEDMLPFGAGALNIAYEQLKERLTKEGLFAQQKRSLPIFPGTIGIVTSPTSAALRDIISVIKRRAPQIKILISPAQVQGEEGINSICLALDKIYQENVDVIIVGRGGGSLEELWCFNEEAVVRKISTSPVPIVSAVGHETDFTLSDYAADLRAATPSMAAELVSPSKEEIEEKFLQYEKRIRNSFNRIINQERQRINYLAHRQVLREPLRILNKFRQEVDTLNFNLVNNFQRQYGDKRVEINLLANKLDALSPLKTISRGYSLTHLSTGEIVRSINQVEVGENLRVAVADGEFICLVQGKKESSHE
ncbi:MAG: exodeoxyribonuclease VII large subunit [Peptococcales bacterium]|jgi:exodeoxyribonuclease VII large subunit